MPALTKVDFVSTTEAVGDQYADGKAAKVWAEFIGDRGQRTDSYKNFLVGLLRSKGCKRVLDVACGTGVDSIMLVEEGFEVVSCDASDKMLKYALRERWDRRDEGVFGKWVIEEANWLTLYDDIKGHVKDGFDAVICLGNSFSQLLDDTKGQSKHRQAISNFHKCLKPGGVLLIDHRNYANVMETGSTPPKSIYYINRHLADTSTSILLRCGKPPVVMIDYQVKGDDHKGEEFRMYFYPHDLKVFTTILKEIFGANSNHKVLGDFQEIERIENPAYYIHIVEKK